MAPATNYSGVVSTGTFVSFEGSTKEYLQVTGRQKLCEVKMYLSSTSGQAFAAFEVSANGTPGIRTTQLYIKPSNRYYFPDPLATYGSLAQYYEVVGMNFEYITSVGTNKGTSFTIGFSPDVAYAEGRGYGSSDVAMYLSDVETLTSALKVPAYSESTTMVVNPMRGFLYTYDDSPDGKFSFGDTAEDRLSWAGCMYIAPNTYDLDLADDWYTVGDIFVTYRVRYKGLVLPATTGVALNTLLPEGKVSSTASALTTTTSGSSEKDSSLEEKSVRKGRSIGSRKKPSC